MELNHFYSNKSNHHHHGRFDEDLKKMFQSHPKDIAVRQKLAEIFIVQCELICIMETWPDVDPIAKKNQVECTPI